MSTLSNKKLCDLADGLAAQAEKSKTAANATEELVKAIKAFAEGVSEEIKKAEEWKIQDNLNEEATKANLGKALGITLALGSYEVNKSINYHEANPRFDVIIHISRSEIVEYIKANPKDTNPKLSIANKFSWAVEILGINVPQFGKITKSMIGKVTVNFIDPP